MVGKAALIRLLRTIFVYIKIPMSDSLPINQSINQSDAVKAPFLPRPGSSAPSGLPRSDLCRSRHQLGQELPQQLCQHPLFEQVPIVSCGRSSCTNALQWCVMKDQAGNQIFTQSSCQYNSGHNSWSPNLNDLYIGFLFQHTNITMIFVIFARQRRIVCVNRNKVAWKFWQNSRKWYQRLTLEGTLYGGQHPHHVWRLNVKICYIALHVFLWAAHTEVSTGPLHLWLFFSPACQACMPAVSAWTRFAAGRQHWHWWWR